MIYWSVHTGEGSVKPKRKAEMMKPKNSLTLHQLSVRYFRQSCGFPDGSEPDSV